MIFAALAPFRLWIMLAAAAALFGSGVYSGHRYASNACAADKVAAIARAIEQADAIAKQDAEVLDTHEQGRERVRTVFQTIREEVIRYVENHAGDAGECLSPDGLRLWRAANAGPAAAGAAGQPDYTLSGGPADATLGTRGAPAGQPYGSGGELSRVPGTAPGLVGLGEK